MDFMNVIYIINLLFLALAFVYEMRFNLHMLQLNGYKNKVHFIWLRHNVRKQNLLFILPVRALLVVFWTDEFIDILMLTGCFIVLSYYFSLSRAKYKKNLVYTGRVKRMIGANLVTVIIILGLLLFAGHINEWRIGSNIRASRLLLLSVAVMSVMCFLEPLLVILANITNRPIEKGIANHYINDAKKILKQMPNLLVIGVTGSYGKTSVKYFLSALLQAKYNVLITPESYNTPMGVVKTIRSELKPVHNIFVCEMGARNVGDIKEICDIVRPTHGVITSIGPQHLESFKTIENIIRTKFELADALPENGLLFLNGDNQYIIGKKDVKNPVYYGMESPKAGYRAADIKVSSRGTEFTVITPDNEKETFQTKLLGQHNVVNILAAIAVAHSLGIPLKDLTIPVRRLQPVEHRLQLIQKGNVTIIDDAFNSNPEGSKMALEVLSLFDGLRVLVTPGMVELGEKQDYYNEEFGKYAASRCDHIILVGRKQTEAIHKGILSEGFDSSRLYVADTFDDAIRHAYELPADGHKYILLENDLPDNY